MFNCFLGTVIPFPTAAAPFSIPTEGFRFLHFLTSICYFRVGTGVDSSHPNGYGVVPRRSFISLMIRDEHFFYVCIGHLHVFSLEKCLFKPSAHF